VLIIEAEAIRALMPRLGDGFVQAVEILQGCCGRVVLSGMGNSDFIAKKVAATLASTVPEAAEEVWATAHFGTRRPGGQGAVHGTIELLLKAQARWPAVLERYRR
jgi:hypothetical protein